MEICRDNHFGTICELGWDGDDAAVACRQLGFPGESELTCGAMRLHHSQAHFVDYHVYGSCCLNEGRVDQQLLEMTLNCTALETRVFSRGGGGTCIVNDL